MPKKTLLYLCLALIWLIEITYLSLFLVEDNTSNSWLDFPHKDKLGHFGFYFGFVFLWNLYFTNIQQSVLKKIVIVAILYGVLMEILQYIMPYGRMFDVKDMLANITGAIFAYFFIKNVWPSIRSLKRKN